MLSLVWLMISAASASDVLLPTFTPSTTSDFGLAEDLTDQTLAAMEAQDLFVVPPSEVQRRAGSAADGCADEPGCVQEMFGRFAPARLAVVGSARWSEGAIEAQVRFYDPQDASPVEVISATISEAELAGFADQVAFFAAELLPLIPPREGAALAPSSGPPPRDNATEQPAKTSVAPEPRESEAARRASGLPPVAWSRFLSSGQDLSSWKEDHLVRAGKVVIEFHGAMAFGDIDRRYDVRISAQQVGDDDFREDDVYQYESFITGQGWDGGLSISYTALWWLDVGISGGVAVGTKQLSSGWEHYKDGSLRDSDSTTYDPAAATMFLVEPRARLLVVATGPVKPYALVGLMVRAHDGYVVPDLDKIDYPDRPGGVALGPTGGAGLAFDIPGGLVAMLELPYTQVVSPKPFNAGGERVQQVPDQLQGTGGLLRFRAGLGFRL